MQGRPSLREILPDDVEWWTFVDESYWQALLEQGEVSPGVVPPADPQETFNILACDPEIDPLTAEAVVESPEEAELQEGWQGAQVALDRGTPFSLQVSGANRGGLLVDWNGLQGFVPASHLKEMPRSQDPHERVAELANRIGDSLTVRVIEVDVDQQRLVFSERAALSGLASPLSLLSALKPGDVCKGRITNLTSFGAFVDLGGVEGLVHISEISWDRVRHPNDVLHPGQEVQVRVLGVNPDERRIALSLKRLRPDPWAGIGSRYELGEVLEGTITNVVDFGAFVRVEEGLEGLIHVSELADGRFLHPRSIVREGDRVQVRVIKIDPDKHHLGLSLRQAHGLG
jgi:small subunit ribosomal protein S1